MGWTGEKEGVQIQNKMGEEFSESIRHPGASPKITEMLVERERGSRVDEPPVLRTGRVSFLCLTGSGLRRPHPGALVALAVLDRDRFCLRKSGEEEKCFSGRAKTVLKGQKSRFGGFKGGFASYTLDLDETPAAASDRPGRPRRWNRVNRL